jgi:hypothetical protein
MTDLLTPAPPPEAIARMAAIPGLAITPSILVVQEGPAGGLGPEGAGAILLLQATFSSPERQEGFWSAAVPVMELLAEAPGMIRRYSFPDGPMINLIALWRSIEDAQAFAASVEHRAAVAGLAREHWQYSHFSALWEMRSNHGRVVFCDCGAVTPMAARSCPTCGAQLVDPYADAAEAGAGG